LENKKKIFPKKPFHTSDIVRGQSRGLGGGFFSMFKKTRTDDSGMVTNQKIVGMFKGRISIENKDEKDSFKAIRESRVKIIVSLIKDLYERNNGKPLEFELADLESYEKRSKFDIILQ
jgi:hypothetical protein